MDYVFYFACVVVGVAGLFFVISHSVIIYFRFRDQIVQNAVFNLKFERVETKLDEIASKFEQIDREIRINSFEEKHPNISVTAREDSTSLKNPPDDEKKTPTDHPQP